MSLGAGKDNRSAGAVGPATLLLVDDREDGLLALQAVLRSPEHRIVTARSGQEALRFLLANQEDLAVLLIDVQMPEMDGFETVSLIKMQERYRHVPVIFVTGIFGDSRFIAQGYEAGAIDYVTKPYQPDILRSKVSVLVELHRKTRLLQKMQQEAHESELAAKTQALEREFSRKERRLAALVENGTDLIALADVDGKLLHLNPAGRSLIGLGETDPLPTLSELFVGGFDHGMDASLEEELLLRHRRTDRAIPVSTRYFPIRDPDNGGRIDSYAAICRDVTKQRQSEQALRDSEYRFRTLANFAPVGIFFADAEGRYEFTNRQWQTLAGIEEEQALSDNGRGWVQALAREDVPGVWERWQNCVRSGEVFDEQVRFATAGRSIRWAQTRAVPLHGADGAMVGYIGSTVDMTDRVLSEATLKHAADELAIANGELQRFAWVASHDLKEPLRMVSNYAGMLERRLKGQLDEESRRFVQYITEGTSRMYALIDGILSLAEIDKRDSGPEAVDCNASFDAVVSNLRIAIEEVGAQVSRGNLPVVSADRTQVAQLLQNLVGNALKFRTERPPRIHVSAESTEEGWVFGVSDNGIGIEPKYFEMIFGVFQRLHPKQRFQGTGVGLAICKKIVEQHGGRIWVESKPDQGTTFRFTFPRLDEPDEFDPRRNSAPGLSAFGF